MWMLLGLAVVIAIVLFWPHGDPQPQPAAHSEPPHASTMTAIPPALVERLAITYRITRWDLFANHLTLWMRNRVLQGFLVLLLGWQLWMWFPRDFSHTSLLELAMRLVGILVFYGGSLGITLVAVGFAMAFLLKHKGVVCEHTLELTDEGLVESTEVNKTLHKWPSVGRIMNIFGYLFIYVGDQISHQVPRRDVPVEQMANFERELRARAAAARLR